MTKNISFYTDKIKTKIKQKGFYGFLRKVPEYIVDNWIPSKNGKRHMQLLKGRKGLKIVEIGVWKGHNAERLMRSLKVNKIFLVDPYAKYKEYTDKDSESQIKRAEEEAHKRLKNFDNTVWVKRFSDEAHEIIDDNVDYIYIDGNHSYEFVKNDIRNYYPKLRKGGIMAGDDIDKDGVSKAVVEFCGEKGLEVNFEAYHPEWYIVK